ncbi:uncharacterized protein EI90DRAFT_3053184 [Cantharellus anzutake]|uniref:uncharacterized protein n=1 Tax=Cantharellus anzutake TaxID=1750568 RepID=UPI001908BE27|nr:uncharacterized protein EI90DRAFT_3053184 [Cantharellus anzutake]KAF8333157.1 hypothetical protein EI90DRAFT_3053184 [Cantharellus anzutake]
MFDALVLPTAPITNYFKETTGFEPTHFTPQNASHFTRAQDIAGMLLKGKIIVGYQLWLSLSALGLSHPADQTRDCGTYFPFQTAITPGEDGFKSLIRHFMKWTIRDVLTNTVEDARAAMDLFRSVEVDWEALIARMVWPCLLPPPEYLNCYS